MSTVLNLQHNSQYIFDSKMTDTVLIATYRNDKHIEISVINKTTKNSDKGIVNKFQLTRGLKNFRYKLLKVIQVSEIEQRIYSMKTLEELR